MLNHAKDTREKSTPDHFDSAFLQLAIKLTLGLSYELDSRLENASGISLAVEAGETRLIGLEIGRHGKQMEEKMSDFVRRLRRQLGMTQEEFAHALGITVGTVNRWENKRFRPSKLARTTIVEFARRHGVSTNLPVAESDNGVGTGTVERDESFH